jgi:hypothetical protein
MATPAHADNGVRTGQTTVGSSTTADSITKAEEKLKEDLETLERRTTHLEQSVVIMLGVAALVIAILFGTAFFGERRLQETIDSVEKRAEKSTASVEQRAEEIKSRFPMLAALETQAQHGLEAIEVMFGPEDWLDDRYSTLEISERQQILTVEPLIALEFAGRTTAPQLRGMANFYFSKFKVEDLVCDLDRALYYAKLALERGNEKFQYLNDYALILDALANKDPKYAQPANDAWVKSSRKEPAQQRCYYNLSVNIYLAGQRARREGNSIEWWNALETARKLMETALTHPNWEVNPSPELASLIHYNLSCCLCREAERDPRTFRRRNNLLDDAIVHLEIASRHKQTKPSSLRDDVTKTDGDLYAIAHHPVYAEEMDKIVRNFERAWKS